MANKELIKKFDAELKHLQEVFPTIDDSSAMAYSLAYQEGIKWAKEQAIKEDLITDIIDKHSAEEFDNEDDAYDNWMNGIIYDDLNDMTIKELKLLETLMDSDYSENIQLIHIKETGKYAIWTLDEVSLDELKDIMDKGE